MIVEIILGIIILFLGIMAMSIGVIFNRKPLSGSCGGLNPNGECSICGGETNKCDNSNLESVST